MDIVFLFTSRETLFCAFLYVLLLPGMKCQYHGRHFELPTPNMKARDEATIQASQFGRWNATCGSLA